VSASGVVTPSSVPSYRPSLSLSGSSASIRPSPSVSASAGLVAVDHAVVVAVGVVGIGADRDLVVIGQAVAVADRAP
jgi:hypothetical protein